jgi:fucose permease
MLLLMRVVAGIADEVDHWQFALPLLLSGLGMGIAISSLFQTVLSNVPPIDVGSGSGALQSFQQIGSALGIAISGQIFFSTLEADFRSGSMPHAAFVDGLGNALIYEVAAFALVAVLVFFLPVPPQARTEQADPRGQQEPVPVEG